MNKITWILLLFTVLIVSSKASDERSEQANLVKALIDKQGKLEVTWKELMTVLVGIEYEITKGDVESFIECMLRDDRTIKYLYEVVDYLHNSHEVYLKKAWTVLGKFFQEVSGVLVKCTKQHITGVVKGILFRFLKPDGFIISKVFTILWYSQDITKDIRGLMDSLKSDNFFDVGTYIGKLIKIAEKIFQPIYEGFSTKEHAFLDGFTQEFAPEISNELELCVGLENEEVYKRIESNILKIEHAKSHEEIVEIMNEITKIYLNVVNNEFCNFGNMPIYLDSINKKFSEWSSNYNDQVIIQNIDAFKENLFQAKTNFDSMRLVDSGKMMGKIVNKILSISFTQ